MDLREVFIIQVIVVIFGVCQDSRQHYLVSMKQKKPCWHDILQPFDVTTYRHKIYNNAHSSSAIKILERDGRAKTG